MHVHLAVLCASGTRLAPTGVERRPAARVFDLQFDIINPLLEEYKDFVYLPFKTVVITLLLNFITVSDIVITVTVIMEVKM